VVCNACGAAREVTGPHRQHCTALAQRRDEYVSATTHDSTGLNLVHSVDCCWGHVSNVRLCARQLSGISGAKSTRTCTVQLYVL
jgi:hypothetical protein